MNANIVLVISLVVIPMAILIWDYYLYNDKVERNSISQAIIDMSKKSSLVPWVIGLGMGILVGHWWG